MPRGPVQLSGGNEQLETANYHYGLGPATFYNIDEFLVHKKTDA